eukprot:11798436-Ditylum_brightwellii.AAC.1
MRGVLYGELTSLARDSTSTHSLASAPLLASKSQDTIEENKIQSMSIEIPVHQNDNRKLEDISDTESAAKSALHFQSETPEKLCSVSSLSKSPA